MRATPLGSGGFQLDFNIFCRIKCEIVSGLIICRKVLLNKHKTILYSEIPDSFKGKVFLGVQSLKLTLSVLRLDADEQQPHPRPHDRLLKRPIVRRAPTHRSAAVRRR